MLLGEAWGRGSVVVGGWVVVVAVVVVGPAVRALVVIRDWVVVVFVIVMIPVVLGDWAMVVFVVPLKGKAQRQERPVSPSVSLKPSGSVRPVSSLNIFTADDVRRVLFTQGQENLTLPPSLSGSPLTLFHMTL